MGGRVGKPRPLHIWSSQKWDTKIKSEGTKRGNGVWAGFGTRRLLSPHIGLPAEHKLGLPDAHNWLVDLELSKESFGKISMGDGRMFFKPFSVYHIMRSSPPSNVFVILTPGLLLPKHAYTGQSPPSNVTESTFHLQCVSWGKLWGGGVLSREEKGEGDMFGELDTYIHTFYF